jgi:hypothetical protein
VSEVAREILGIYTEDWLTNAKSRPQKGRRGPKHLYQHAIRGFSVQLKPQEAEALADDYRVLYVEEDGEVGIVASQTGATWGLDRIDQRDLPLNSTYTYSQTGASVHATSSTPASARPTQFAGDGERLHGDRRRDTD